MTGRNELDRYVNDDTLLDSEDLLARFTVEEVRGWLTIARALRQWADRGQPYAAVPHALTMALGTPSYSMDHLAPAVDPEGHYCGLDGFYRDELAGVDWWCLLPYAHGEEILHGIETSEADTIHGWDRAVRCRPAPWEPPLPKDRAMAPPWVVVADAAREGITAELDSVARDLVVHTVAAAAERGFSYKWETLADRVPMATALRRIR